MMQAEKRPLSQGFVEPTEEVKSYPSHVLGIVRVLNSIDQKIKTDNKTKRQVEELIQKEGKRLPCIESEVWSAKTSKPTSFSLPGVVLLESLGNFPILMVTNQGLAMCVIPWGKSGPHVEKRRMILDTETPEQWALAGIHFNFTGGVFENPRTQKPHTANALQARIIDVAPFLKVN
jgi:hypothetical protein